MVISVNGYLAILAALAAERLFELALPGATRGAHSRWARWRWVPAIIR
jgi:hypothetical protein